MKRNIVYILTIAISICVYLFTFALIVTYKPTYEYSMYYKQKLTKYWAENTMTITPTEKMLFCYALNPVDLSSCTIEQADLQFLGKNVKEKVVDNKLDFIYGNNFSIYWQWKDEVIFNEIYIIINLICENNFTIEINDKVESCESTDNNFIDYKVKLDFKRQNELKFISNEAFIKIKQISFEII